MKTKKNNLKFEFSSGTILFYQKSKKRFYFLLKDSNNNWGFPKGNIEKNESSLQTATRETFEETNIKNIKILKGFKKEIQWFYFAKDKKKVFKKAFFYLAKANNKKFKISFEHKDGGWYEYNKALELLKFNNYKNLLKQAEEFLNSFTFSLYKNIFEIGTNPLRLEALEILAQGVFAALPENIIKKKVKYKKDYIYFDKLKINSKKYKRVFIFGIGKASFHSALALKNILPKTEQTIILDPSLEKDIKTKDIEAYKVSHPFISLKNIKISQYLSKIAKSLKKEDLAIFVISGGGSASFEDLNIDLKTHIKLTEDLFKVGATIKELNIIRKHLSKVKGGGFAKMIYPARIVSLILSDVIGDDLSTIASGPTVLDPSTKDQALAILKKYKLEKKYKSLKFLETPKDKKFFKNVSNILILTNKDSLLAMKKQARKFNWQVKIISDKLKGEAREIGQKLLKKAKKGFCLLAGGETTVTIKGDGKGGRNQEVSLGGLKILKKGEILISLASDGHDNTDFAGAIADFEVKKIAKDLNLDINEYLDDNNSLNFFKKTRSLIKTDYTGTNIADLFIVLKK